VTIYGQADAAYTSVKSGVNSFTGVQGAGRGSNFLGFMGTEDLGGGLKANFKLEAQYNLDSGAGNASNTTNQAAGGATTQTGASTAAATINSYTGAASTQDRFSMAGAQGLTFNRWSYAGVSGGFGEIRVGREYTPTFQAVLAADTTGANGVQNTLFQTLYLGQANSVATTTSASNGISWESPRMSGVQLKVQVYYGENLKAVSTANSALYSANSGNGNSYRLDYTQGPLSVGTSAQKTDGGTNTVSASASGVAMIPGEYKVSTTYGKYDFGVVALALSQTKENLVVAAAEENKTTLIGLSYPVNATLKINATMASSERAATGTVNAKGKQTGLQALYSLSKRTDLYVNYAETKNSLGKIYGIGNGSSRLATVDNNLDKSTAYQIGLRHSF
jgi:predicted porin